VNAKGTRVLIIDDDPLIRTLLVSALRKDCLVGVAAEGSEGFGKALELKPDVAVIDVNMPGWDGLKTLEAFRAHPSLRDTKIIMLTADSSKQTVMAAVRAGANDYLIKTSFSKAEFYRKLNLLVPGTIPQSAAVPSPHPAESESLPTDAGDSHESADPSDSDESLAASSNGHKRHAHDAVAAAADAPHSDVALDRATPGHSDIDPRLQVMIDGWD
jgi:CheY-like chemotaxis protein